MLLRHRTTVGSDQIVLQRSVSSKASENTLGNLAKNLPKVIQVELFDAQEKHYIYIFFKICHYHNRVTFKTDILCSIILYHSVFFKEHG